MKLDADTFLGVVAHTPLVAVDLVLVRGEVGLHENFYDELKR